MSAVVPGAAVSHLIRGPRLHVAGVLEFAGTRVEVWTDRPAALMPFLAAHRQFYRRAEHTRPAKGLRLHILAGGTHAAIPRIRFPDLSWLAVRGLIEQGGCGRFVRMSPMGEEDRAVYADRLLNLEPALVHSPDGCDVLEPGLLGSYLELLLLSAALERAPNLVSVHAAAIAWEGRAALICGEGGAGKSTLTLALLRQGCAYLTDEVALLDTSSGRVRAYARSLGIRSGTLSLMEGVEIGAGAFQATSLAGDTKWFADPKAVALGGVCEEAVLEHVWFLSGFGPDLRIRDEDAWKATGRFARSLRHVRGTAMDRFWTAMEVVRHCHARDVIAGTPAATAEALIQLMGGEEGGKRIG